MTEKDISRYLALVSRRSFILTHSGISWKPEYSQEIECIDQEIARLRVLIDREHAKREKPFLHTAS